MNEFDFDEQEDERPIRRRPQVKQKSLGQKTVWLCALLVIFAPLVFAAIYFRVDLSRIHHVKVITVIIWSVGFLVIMPIWASFVVLIAKIVNQIVD